MQCTGTIQHISKYFFIVTSLSQLSSLVRCGALPHDLRFYVRCWKLNVPDRHYFLFLWSITRQYFLNQTLLHERLFFSLTFLTCKNLSSLCDKGDHVSKIWNVAHSVDSWCFCSFLCNFIIILSRIQST